MGGERATREWERLNTEEGKGENNQERKNEGKKDGDGGGGDMMWSDSAGFSVSSNLCSGLGVSACR